MQLNMQILIFTLLALSASSQHVLYVKPNISSSCPGQPCLTLDQYTVQGRRYFSMGTTFLFLAGNHNLNSKVVLDSISDATFSGMEADSDVTVQCKAAILCNNVTNFTIQGMTFINAADIHRDIFFITVLKSKAILVFNMTFQAISIEANTQVSAVHCQNSDVIILNSFFEGNRGNDGGAIFAVNGSISLNGNVFIKNKAMQHGGAIAAKGSSLFLEDTLGNTFSHNSAGDYGGALVCEGCKINIAVGDKVTKSTPHKRTNGDWTEFNSDPAECEMMLLVNQSHVHTTYYSNNEASKGGAIFLHNSVALLTGTVVIFQKNSAENGGALYSVGSRFVLNAGHLCFTANRAQPHGGPLPLQKEHPQSLSGYDIKEEAHHKGGAIYLTVSRVTLSGTIIMLNNNIGRYGGALNSRYSTVTSNVGYLIFRGNRAEVSGGAYLGYNSSLYLGELETNSYIHSFEDNSAGWGGGAIYCQSGSLHLKGRTQFVNSSAVLSNGGAIAILFNTTAHFGGILIKFNNNSAPRGGGGISVYYSQLVTTTEKILVSNSSVVGLFVYISEVQVNNIHVTGNSGGGIYVVQSNIIFSGNVRIDKNVGETGGGIRATLSSISFKGNTTFHNNSAVGNGGAVFASKASNIALSGRVVFMSNWAENGGAMHFEDGATMTLKLNTTLITVHNHATERGGAIYHRDTITPSQCKFSHLDKTIDFLTISSCFIESVVLPGNDSFHPFLIYSINDTAGYDGSFLYGGLLDKCVVITVTHFSNGNIFLVTKTFYDKLLKNFGVFSRDTTSTNLISSEAYMLCFCESSQNYNCSQVVSVETYRGRKITAYFLALAQGLTIISTNIRTKMSPAARLETYQRLQSITRNCTGLSYNLYSTEDQEELVLYPEGGSCHDIGLARAVINVTFLPCPDAFVLSGDECVCEKRLQAYNAECTIFDDEIYIIRKAKSTFWVNASYSNTTYYGLISYPTCPTGYCRTGSVNISLIQPDIQCDQNRSGMLCGACATNYSLMLGSSKCQKCSNSNLALLLSFAAAGIALVVFLTILRMTVATGMINCIILYCNIVQANRDLLFPSSANTNVLTVFIAWINLDLGFHTCFYHGMDAYAQTWLQFAFPIYVWILISLIVLTSRYSITLTKLAGSNPIAVLATLLLMSYAKILKIIIEVYSSIQLEYPGNERVAVWLKDANVPYLQSQHLALTVVTTLVLVFFFLPYTLLLLIGHKLYRFTGRKYCCWLIRIKPLLDSYYAPYKMHTRYWTGFLLLVRCALYIVFSFNSLGHTIMSLLAINIAFTAIIVIAWLSVNIYTNVYTNAMEALVYLNLITISATALAGANSPTLVSLLVGIVFAFTMGIIVYHFHILYIAKSNMWLKILAIKDALMKSFTATEATPLLAPVANTPPQQNVTRSVITLREPLLTN